MSQLVASIISASPQQQVAGLTLSDWSLQADSSQLPFAFHRVCITVLRWPCSVAMLRPVLASHTFTRPSLLPLASTALVGCQSQPLTSPPWPVIVTSDLQVGKSHTCAAQATTSHQGSIRVPSGFHQGFIRVSDLCRLYSAAVTAHCRCDAVCNHICTLQNVVGCIAVCSRRCGA